MADPARARKLAKRIGTIVASAIQAEIKDPELQYVTITDTRMTGDLHDATIYYTVMGENVEAEPDMESAAAALERAKGALRTRVGAGTGVRFTPTLTFVADTVPDAARHMEELLARAKASDAEVAATAAGAKPAGDADPYKATDDEWVADELEVDESAADADLEGPA